MENGKSTAYGLGALEDRGVMFIEPGVEVYEGMIVGAISFIITSGFDTCSSNPSLLIFSISIDRWSSPRPDTVQKD